MPDYVEDDRGDEDAEDETEKFSLNGHGDSQPITSIVHGNIF